MSVLTAGESGVCAAVCANDGLIHTSKRIIASAHKDRIKKSNPYRIPMVSARTSRVIDEPVSQSSRLPGTTEHSDNSHARHPRKPHVGLQGALELATPENSVGRYRHEGERDQRDRPGNRAYRLSASTVSRLIHHRQSAAAVNGCAAVCRATPLCRAGRWARRRQSLPGRHNRSSSSAQQ